MMHHIRLKLNTHYFSDSAARFCPSFMCTYSVTLCQCYTLPVLAILYPPQVIANYELTNFFTAKCSIFVNTTFYYVFGIITSYVWHSDVGYKQQCGTKRVKQVHINRLLSVWALTVYFFVIHNCWNLHNRIVLSWEVQHSSWMKKYRRKTSFCKPFGWRNNQISIDIHCGGAKRKSSQYRN